MRQQFIYNFFMEIPQDVCRENTWAGARPINQGRTG